MLIKLKSDAFRYNTGNQRPVVTFSKGLNIVVGNPGSSSSVGKSTFLMAIDFAFGGDDYINKLKNVVHNHVDKHYIAFTFEFSGKQHHFIRSTAESENVYIADEQLRIYPTIKFFHFRPI